MDSEAQTKFQQSQSTAWLADGSKLNSNLFCTLCAKRNLFPRLAARENVAATHPQPHLPFERLLINQQESSRAVVAADTGRNSLGEKFEPDGRFASQGQHGGFDLCRRRDVA